jgi:integrase
LRVLSPIWTTKIVTADRVRNRIENILAWSITAGHRRADNCARWAGHLEHLLASPADLRKAKGVRAQPSVPYQELSKVMVKLRARGTMAALAAEFLTLTAVRTADVLTAKRADLDHKDRVWRIKSFSKSGLPLDVPLSTRAYDIVQQAELLAADAGSPFLFTRLNGQSLAKAAMHKEIVNIVGTGKGSPHGMRSSFRSWCQDIDGISRETAERSLGHKVHDTVEGAYARGDQLVKRRALLQRWADYLAAPVSHDVLPMQRRRQAS